MAVLEGEIGKLQADQLAGMRDNLNALSMSVLLISHTSTRSGWCMHSRHLLEL